MCALIRPLYDIDKTSIENHIFFGTVVDNDDADALDGEQIFRVKARVVELFGDPNNDVEAIPDSDLPWAMQMRAPFFGGSNAAGFFVAPAIDSIVIILFPSGEIHSPIYIGDPIFNGATVPDFVTGNYPFVWGWQDTASNKWVLDMVAGTLTFLLNGSMNTTITKDLTEDIGGDWTVTIGGKTAVTVTGNTDWTTPLFTLHGDLHVTGAVIAGYGGGDQVGLQTHIHTQMPDSDGDSEVPTDQPMPDT